MQAFWNTMFAGQQQPLPQQQQGVLGPDGVAVPVLASPQESEEEEPAAKRHRTTTTTTTATTITTTTTPSYPAAHDMQQIQDLFRSVAANDITGVVPNPPLLVASTATAAAAVPSSSTTTSSSTAGGVSFLAPTTTTSTSTTRPVQQQPENSISNSNNNNKKKQKKRTRQNKQQPQQQLQFLSLQQQQLQLHAAAAHPPQQEQQQQYPPQQQLRPLQPLQPLQQTLIQQQQQQHPQQQSQQQSQLLQPLQQIAVESSIGISNNNVPFVDVDAQREAAKRKRNALNAKATRMRKKHAASMVQMELKALQRENEWLKSIVKREIPEDEAQKIISECCYKSEETATTATSPRSLLRAMGYNVPDGTTSTEAEQQQQQQQHHQPSLLGHSDFELLESLAKDKQSFCLTDPRQTDNPVVYASCAFLRLTGYAREQVIGRNCRFLQGIDTDPDAVQTIRQAVEQGKDGAACLVNYKADGTPFWNHLFVTALRDKENRIVNHVGVLTEVDKPLDGIGPRMPLAHNAEDDDDELKQSSSSSTTLTAKLTELEKEKMQRQADSTHLDTAKLAAFDQETIQQEQPQQPQQEAVAQPPPVDLFDVSDKLNVIDWSQLAEVLEADYFDESEDAALFAGLNDDHEIIEQDPDSLVDGVDSSLGGCGDDSSQARSSNTLDDVETNLVFEKSFYSFFAKAPRELVIRTIRSEIVDSMTRLDGDVSDPQFMSALELLSKMFREQSLQKQQQQQHFHHDGIIHGQWREISRPVYQQGGMIGINERGDKVYSLGKMSFNMFTPGNLRTTVQSTINRIEPARENSGTAAAAAKALPAAVPWSLRRELAQQQGGGEQGASSSSSSSKLKSYDVMIAVTIEPGQFNAAPGETIPSPSQRLRATYVVNGWFLPDPETPNRLSVWFTGGQLSPVPAQQHHPAGASSPHESYFDHGAAAADTTAQQSSLDEWMELFGAEHKRTWGEALSVMGAQLFLGAELPDGMEPDGTMSYTLHRPYGGHGRGYVDIMYADSEMLITKGNSGTIHVMVREEGEGQSPPVVGAVNDDSLNYQHSKSTMMGTKRYFG